jgi:hypothetical protein
MGLIHPDTITKCLTDVPVFEQPEYTAKEVMGLRKCFVLYVSFPRERWADIARAEPDTPEGNRIFAELKQEYLERYVAPSTDSLPTPASRTADLEYGVANKLS